MTFLFPILVIALALGYTFYMRRRASTSLASSGPAFTAFFQRTGYQYPDMLGQPAEAQGARAISDGQSGKPYTGIHYVRDFHGVKIENIAKWGSSTDEHGKAVYRTSNQWDATFPQPLRFGIQIADKRLASTLHGLASEILTRKRRVWNAHFPHQVQTGIPAIDSRFVVYASDPAWATQMLASQPALVALLDGWAELDLTVGGQRGVFADPESKNMNAAMGGTIGNMAVGFDYAKRLDLSVPVHERVAELLATAGRACA